MNKQRTRSLTRVCDFGGCTNHLSYQSKRRCAEHNLSHHPGAMAVMRRAAWAAKLDYLTPRRQALRRLLPATIREIRDLRPDLYPFERGNPHSIASSRERMKADLRALGARRVAGDFWTLERS